MKYYVVPTEALSFKEEGKVIVPSKAAIEANLLEMLAKSGKENDAAMAFTKRSDAEKLANELDPEKKDHEGFAVVEISAPKADYNEDDIEVAVAEGKTETLDFVLVPYSQITFVKAHLGHLDKSLKGETVAVNAKASDLLEQAAVKPVVEEPATTTADADKNKDPVKTEEASSSFSLKSFAKGLLVTGAFAAAAYASMVSGITPAVLAYFGVKAGFAATLAASAALVAVASTAVYGAVRVATSFVRFVASKFASKAEETADKPAEEAAKDTKEAKDVPDCCKGKVCETTVEATADAKAEVEKTAEATKTADVAEEAIATKHAKVVSFPKKAAPVVAAAKEPEAKAGHRMTMRKR